MACRNTALWPVVSKTLHGARDHLLDEFLSGLDSEENGIPVRWPADLRAHLLSFILPSLPRPSFQVLGRMLSLHVTGLLESACKDNNESCLYSVIFFKVRATMKVKRPVTAALSSAEQRPQCLERQPLQAKLGHMHSLCIATRDTLQGMDG
eukprot:523260-Hanusia_phi.AAC.2